MTQGWIRVVAPRFVARLELRNGRVVDAAPILRRGAMGISYAQLRDTAERQGWALEEYAECQ